MAGWRRAFLPKSWLTRVAHARLLRLTLAPVLVAPSVTMAAFDSRDVVVMTAVLVAPTARASSISVAVVIFVMALLVILGAIFASL